MPEQRSLIAYEYWKDSSQRFDYFVTGVTGALVAFVAQAYHPEKIGLTPNSLELLSIFLLVGSVIAGFKRVEANVEAFRLMSEGLDAAEKLGALTANLGLTPVLNLETGEILTFQDVVQQREYYSKRVDTVQTRLKKYLDMSLSAYKWRNRLLASGFFALVASRILVAYWHAP
jgi:hypothetical protein